MVTDGSNYIALNDDVYMYTGVTSINSDQSNLGFLLSNQRTKETKFYSAPGATEAAAQASAQGVVQDLGYIATFPLLLNIAGEPTYFIPLKDAANLVKSYAMVNVARYDIVATGNSVDQCEQEYVRLLADRGVTAQEELPQTQTEGTVAEIRSAVLDGTTYYFLRLEDEEVFYAVSASASPTAVLLDVGDWVSIEYGLSEEENGEIRSGSVLLDYRKSASSDADRGVSSSSHASDPESAPSSSPAPAR